MNERIRSVLLRPDLPRWLALLGVLLAAPSLWIGLCGDDFYHRAIFQGGVEGLDPLTGLFTFLDGGELNAAMLETGLLPWWTSEHLRVAFFRPLTAITHMLDYALWPDRFGLQHAHSLLWFAAGIALVGRLFQRITPGVLAAGVAGLIFAVDDAHAMVASWIANRNALLTICFGMIGLLTHMRWRRESSPAMALVAFTAITAGLLSGEAALGAVAYIAAWQLTLSRGGLWSRFRPLIPYIVLIVVWRLIYNNLGYGAEGSGLYVDPGNQPVRFLGALLERWPILILGQWFQAPIDLWPFFPRSGQLAMTTIGAVSVGVVGWMVAPLLKARPEARFYALGMALSLVPLCAAFPMDRLLIFTGIGAAGLLGMLIAEPGERRRLALGMAVLHIPFAAVMLVARIATMPLFAGIFAIGDAKSPRDAAIAEQTLLFLNGNDFAVTYTHVLRSLDANTPGPKRVESMSSIFTNNDVFRKDIDSLVITAEGGFLASSIDRLFRDTSERFTTGQRIERPDFTVVVLSLTPDGRPGSVRFDFRAPLEDPTFRWMMFTGNTLIEVGPPAIGEHLYMPAALPTPGW